MIASTRGPCRSSSRARDGGAKSREFWVVGCKGFPFDGERALVEGDRLGITPLILTECRKSDKILGHVRVIRSERTFPNGQRALEEHLRLGVPALLRMDACEPVEAGRYVRVIGSQ